MSGKRSRAFRAFQKVKTLKPSRSLFDLSHEVLLTADMFKLYPICAMEMSPGDTFHIANQSVTRLQPLNAPVMSRIEQCTHYFFVPYRILDENWTEFITGGVEGEFGGTRRSDSHVDSDGILDEPSEVAPVLPRWVPSDGKNGVGSLWDYFGLPVNVDPKGAYPLDYLRRAYNLIWNEFYRDENLQEEVGLDNEDILYRSWKKDYFTSALLSQQRGVAPAMPISGTVDVFGDQETVPLTGFTVLNSSSYSWSITATVEIPKEGTNFNAPSTINVSYTYHYGVSGTGTGIADATLLSVSSVDANHVKVIYQIPYNYSAGNDLVSVTVNGSPVLGYYPITLGDFGEVGFQVKDLRQAFQIQKWLELANRGGVRYTEFLRAFFGVSPRDDRLQRPEYIGGSRSPIVISEVLQTSSTENEPTPQGYLAGHGLGAERTYIGSYSAQEYGVLIGLMSYVTPPVYTQGINRMWLRRSKYDFLFPQFTHLSEQAIEGAEIFATGTESENRKVWGFNEVYDELRAMTSKVVGKMRTTFEYWHLARKFENKPALNSDFISGKDVSKRIFAVQSEEGIICHYANIIRAVRPLPKYGTPGGV